MISMHLMRYVNYLWYHYTQCGMSITYDINAPNAVCQLLMISIHAMRYVNYLGYHYTQCGMSITYDINAPNAWCPLYCWFPSSVYPYNLYHLNSFSFVFHYVKPKFCLFISLQKGLTALHIACREGNMEVVSELLRRGANIEVTTKVCTQLKLNRNLM